MTGIESIAAERRRQIEVEGWSAEHDDRHVNGEMAVVAAIYARRGGESDRYRAAFGDGGASPKGWPWTWSMTWWKPRSRRRDLVRAGALIAAEIDRLDRLAQREAP